MPQYEYMSDDNGEIITLLRPMARADDPVEDPAGRGRTFTRRLSAIQVAPPTSLVSPPGHCPCGDPRGPCNS
jgi:hypothetical protein